MLFTWEFFADLWNCVVQSCRMIRRSYDLLTHARKWTGGEKMAKKKKKTAPPATNGAAGRKKATGKLPAAKSEPAQLVSKELPLRRHVSPDMNAVLANHVVVRSDLNLFQLFFFDAEQPLVVNGDSDDVKNAAAAMTHVDAHCVSRVVIPPQVIPALIQALQSNLETRNSVFAAMVKAEAAKDEKK